MKNKLLILLALCLALSACAGCDGSDDPAQESSSSTEIPSETATESTAEEDTTEALPDVQFGPLLGVLDFGDLAKGTEGQEYVNAMYDRFLASVERNPEQVLHDGEAGNYFRVLTSAAEDKRHPVMLEISHTDQKKWNSYLISTENDFVLIVQDAKKKSTFTVGLTEGGVEDQTEFMDEEDRALLDKMITENGYEATLNQVRDEFFCRLFKWTEVENDGVRLGFTGKTHNVWGEEHTMNPPQERDYTISEIQFVNAEDIGEVFITMTLTYDIPNDISDLILPGSESKGLPEKETE
ncbi:MAG: hypothetical protein IKW66_00380 [Clostridia bacterium]|nr:hypothetical protein [Clostridia bacterium]